MNKTKNEAGVSMIEFALVLPFLILILFGVIQYGWLFGAKLSLMNTTASAARFSTVGAPRPTETEIRQMFMANLIAPVQTNDVQSVTVTENVNGVVDLREVKAVAKIKLFLPFVVPSNNNGFVTLTEIAKMR